MRRLTLGRSSQRANLMALVLFGVAFGYVEASVVYYLRALMRFHENYAMAHYRVYLNLGFITFVTPIHSLLVTHRISDIEVARESATIIMLVCVSFIAAPVWIRRLGAFLVSFACWDLSYYLVLRIIDDWPRTLLTKDVFFLIPVTWIGPVLTPIVISIAMLVAGVKLYVERQ